MSLTITLSNGKVLSDVELSGTTFISPAKLTRADFEGALSPVKIDGTDPENGELDVRGTHERMNLVNLFYMGTRTGFTLEDVKKPDASSNEVLRADVDYLMMLTGEA